MVIDKEKQLRERALQLPLQPGVYIMYNKSNEVIYVGKAKALKNRVSQYFGSHKNHDDKVIKMVSNVDRFETIVTDSEFEALVLECSLIKQYAPKYNILLKDDKGYNYIKVTPPPWSRIKAVKASEVVEDGSEYIGPYMSSWAVNSSVDEANKIFRLPVCNRTFEKGKRQRPCLNFHIKQCIAPCRGVIPHSEYQERVDEAVSFLKGGSTASVKILTEKMNEASENLQFERAAVIRDKINAIKKMSERQKVVSVKVPEQDVIALAMGHSSLGDGCVEVFRFKEGRLYDREQFILKETGDGAEARGEFIKRYYSIRDIPPRITIDMLPADSVLLSDWLSDKAGRKVSIVVPQKGEQHKLVEMARNNAAEHLAQSAGRTGREASALDELAKLLCLDKIPVRIESYDISNMGGSDNVAGMVVFRNGKPSKSDYRRFKIKTVEGQDDYASMVEVITRRFNEYKKLTAEGETTGFAEKPDLILLDGGKGHVHVISQVMNRMGFGDIPLFGMVKDDKHRTRAVTGDGGEISIQSTRRAFTLISDIQEEVHRYAIGYHRQQRGKSSFNSELTNAPMIGKERANALLKSFKTMKAIRNASVEELTMIKGMTQPAAESLYAYLHKE